MAASTSRLIISTACAALAGCGSLLGLDELARVDCVEDCGARASETAGSSSGSGKSGAASLPGGGQSLGGGHAGVGNGSGGNGSGGSSPLAGGGTGQGEAGSSGSSGGMPPTGLCPGGPAPADTWQEHWRDHTEALALRSYDDCVALYVDADMSAVDTDWIASFLTEAWIYNLTTYGKLGSERLHAVLHQDKHLGGHAAVFYEPTHDGHNVIDVGVTTWDEEDYDELARGLSEVVEYTAALGKRGSPGAAQWHGEGFAQIYTYDLYVGLGMTDHADRVWEAFEPTHFTYPVPNSYWFADFYYPTWRDYGQAQALVGFFELLKQHYPASTDMQMQPMNWGEYIHFASGAASSDLQEQATYAFGWTNEWEAELEQAREDFSAIEY